MPEYRLTQAAEDDLIGIWQYSDDTWGRQQADRYYDRLRDCCDHIADASVPLRPVDGCRAVFLHRCEQHCIFYSRAEGLVILAFLNERMDLPNRLAERFDRSPG